MEILGPVEVLGQQGAADDLPLHFHQGAVGLAGKGYLADTPDHQRIGAA